MKNSPNESEHFSHAQASLPPSSLRRVWRSVASRLDGLIYEQFIRRAHFSVGGAAQLKQVDDALNEIGHEIKNEINDEILACAPRSGSRSIMLLMKSRMKSMIKSSPARRAAEAGRL